MATTLTDVITRIDQIIGDTSTNSISTNDRLVAASIATQDIMSEFGFDHMNVTYVFDYLDTINYYKLNANITDVIEPIDLRRFEDDQSVIFTRKSPREIAEEIANNFGEPSYSLERRDRDTYLGVSYNSPHTAIVLNDASGASTSAEGLWVSDTTNSDALATTADGTEFRHGNGSIRFDIDVSQSANNRATVENSTITSIDLSSEVDVAHYMAWVYIPDVTNFTSITAYWGSDSSNYWSGTVTTDIYGESFSNGWNEIDIDWADTTQTGTVDNSAIDYLRLDFNYGAGQGDDTHFRFDHIRMVRPEVLELHYQSQVIGTNSGGTLNRTTAYGATTDIPFYSDQYDYFINPVSHKSAAILFRQMGLYQEAEIENTEFTKQIRDLKKRFPSQTNKPVHNFKIKGLNLNK